MLRDHLGVSSAERAGSVLMHCCSAVDSLCDVLKGFPASVGAESRELEGNGARVLACIQYILLLWKKTLCHVAARRRRSLVFCATCTCDKAVQR